MDIYSTLLRVNSYTKNPNMKYITQQSKIKLKVMLIIEIGRMNSILKIKSGEVIVISRFIEYREDKQSFKVFKGIFIKNQKD